MSVIDCKKSFLYFKAQQDNMELLDACLEKNVRLVDYERMCDEKGKLPFLAQIKQFVLLITDK